jgi:nitroreductase
MDVLDAIYYRRSIRQYTTEQVSDEHISVILKAAMYAPSAVNKQPWHFIVFREKSTIKAITEKHPSASMLLNASAAILVCWDEKLQHDIGYGPVDCSAATQNMLLAAYNMGIGSVWVGIYPRQSRMDFVREVFELPPDINAFSLVSLGFPAEKKMQPQRYNPERIHFEKW